MRRSGMLSVLLHNRLPQEQWEALTQNMACFSDLYEIESIADEQELAALETKVARSCAATEDRMPVTERTGGNHGQLHLPEQIFWYDHLRNTHAFKSERWMGYLARFVTNPARPEPNIVRNRDLSQLHMHLPHPVRESVRGHLRRGGYVRGENSYLRFDDTPQQGGAKRRGSEVHTCVG